jgi:hypothetical protein
VIMPNEIALQLYDLELVLVHFGNDLRLPLPGLVTTEQLGRRPSALLVLAIDKGERLPVGVAHNETRGRFLRTRAAGGGEGA